MTITRHGIAIGIERVDERFFLTFKAVGRLTHADYEQITPMIESALAGVNHPRISAYVDATDLQGWDLRAAWDDLRLGLRYGREFDRIAIVGDQSWLGLASTLTGWFTSGKVRTFEDEETAFRWLTQADDAST